MGDENSIQSKGGIARARVLTPYARSEIARSAATARWNAEQKILKATHMGPLTIGEVEIQCAVLEDGTRVLTQQSFLRSIGRSHPGGGQARNAAIVDLPFFLTAENLKPFISDDLRRSSTPVFFRPLTTGGRQTTAGGKGGRGYAVGYRAPLLPEVCKVFLAARDVRALLPSQLKLAERCDILLRGIATVGIIALVDEATGFQYVRDRRALQEILDQYVGRELAKWAKRFPDEFYEQIFRLKNWNYNPASSKRPMMMARLTVDLVYDRIGPGLTKELKERRQEIFENTGKKGKLNQVLTPDVGHPALQHHLSGLSFLAKAFPDGNWNGFYRAVERVAPRFNRTLPLFPDDDAIPATNAPPPPSSR